MKLATSGLYPLPYLLERLTSGRYWFQASPGKKFARFISV
jgi:hypothetical protein